MNSLLRFYQELFNRRLPVRHSMHAHVSLFANIRATLTHLYELINLYSIVKCDERRRRRPDVSLDRGQVSTAPAETLVIDKGETGIRKAVERKN
jgi:hypothetical protein